MLKVALMAVVAAASISGSAAMAANFELDPPTLSADAVTCHPVESLDVACTLRLIDANGDGTISATELASFATPSTLTVDGSPLHVPRSTGLDFKDAAAEPATLVSARIDHDGSHRLLPALFALGALVVLLGGRPT